MSESILSIHALPFLVLGLLGLLVIVLRSFLSKRRRGRP